jgi:hypothetical protein
VVADAGLDLVAPTQFLLGLVQQPQQQFLQRQQIEVEPPSATMRRGENLIV